MPFNAPMASAPAAKLLWKLPSQNEPKPVYQYSVIPGGVFDREELIEKINGDPIIAAHYADFKSSDVNTITAEKTKWMHVSYRINNEVFWTAKTLRIPKGETLISDGRNTARTRCGNRISVKRMEPVSKKEPPIEAFDIIVAETASDSATDGDTGELLIAENSPYLPEDAVVPEPGTLSLLIGGLTVFFVAKFVRKR
jgi:hypothetical protein